MKVPLKAVAHFVAQGHMRGHRPCHHGAFGLDGIPHGTSQWRREVSLLTSHLVGPSAILGHIVPNFPLDSHIVHDSVLRRHGVERVEFVRRNVLRRQRGTSADPHRQSQQSQGAEPTEAKVVFNEFHEEGVLG